VTEADLAALAPAIRARARNHTPPQPLDQEDLVQEGMLAVLKLQRRPELGEKAWNAYALRRAEGAMIDAIRAARWGKRWHHDPERAPLSMSGVVADEGGPVELLDTIPAPADDLTGPIADGMLASIPNATDRRAVELVAEGWRLSEIGPMLGVSHSRISQRVRRARQSVAA
jgi:RNA polymerase sigma factor (sigma-70 family)